MWSQVTPSGKVRFFERYTDRAGKRKVVSVLMPDGKKSTQRLAYDVLRRKMQKPAGIVITFGELVEMYLEYIEMEMKPQTYAVTKMHFRPIVRLIGEETMLHTLTAPKVRAALYDGSASKYNGYLKHFRAALRWAYREEMVSNVDFLDRLPKMRTERRREALAGKYLEADELKTLLDGMTVEKWKLLTEFLVLSGLRIGEATALLQEDVNTDAREIRVNKTYARNINAVSMSAKTAAGNRSISMQDELLDCVHRINEIMPRRRKIFFDCGGKYLDYDIYSKYFRENTERLVGRRLTVHALRHTHVALLAAAGIPLDAISRRLGHSDSEVTRNVYMHVTQKLKEKDADQIRSVRLL